MVWVNLCFVGWNRLEKLKYCNCKNCDISINKKIGFFFTTARDCHVSIQAHVKTWLRFEGENILAEHQLYVHNNPIIWLVYNNGVNLKICDSYCVKYTYIIYFVFNILLFLYIFKEWRKKMGSSCCMWKKKNNSKKLRKNYIF